MAYWRGRQKFSFICPISGGNFPVWVVKGVPI